MTFLLLEGYLHREKSVWAGEVEEKGGAYSGFSGDILHNCVHAFSVFRVSGQSWVVESFIGRRWQKVAPPP